MSERVISVGAGKSQAHFPEEVFPTPEGFNGVHDDPSVKALFFEGDERYGLIHFEFVGVSRDIVGKAKTFFAEYASMNPDNIGIHNVHVLSTPHGWHDQDLKTDEDRQKSVRFENIILDAARAAVKQAVDRAVPAKIGYTETVCSINSNRNILTDAGVWHGSDDNRPHNSRVPIIRFDTMDDKPIAMLYGFHSQASVLDGCVMSDGGKLVSADISGAASGFIEKEFGEGFVAMYITGAGGDEGPVIRASQNVVGRGGRTWKRDIHEEGFVLVRLFGEHLGQQVVIRADNICCEPLTDFGIITRTCVVAGQKSAGGPGKLVPCFNYSYKPDEPVACDITIMSMNDVIFIGLRPEICAQMVINIQNSVPDRKLMFATFFDIGADDSAVYDSEGNPVRKVGKYMATAEMYDEITYQSMNSMFAKGGAEVVSEVIINMIRQYEVGNNP